MNQQKFDFNGSQPLNLTTTINEDDLVQRYVAFTFLARLVVYLAILALLLLVLFMILKCIGHFDNERTVLDEVTAPETNRLRPGKAMQLTYGSCENDFESGNCSSSNSSDEDLYDGKLCVICYDGERNCFFVPCGHCATCHDCAQRIFNDENKACPVCRRLVRKVRKLFVS